MSYEENNKSYESTHSKNEKMRLARAYIEIQKLDQVYPAQEALIKGTAFPELYSPY